MEEYKKYRDSKRRSKAFWNGVHKVLKKSSSRHKKVLAQKEAERKKRIKAYKNKREKNQNKKDNNTPITAKDIVYFVVLCAIVAIIIELLINFGIKNLFYGIIYGIIAIIVVIFTVILIKSIMETSSEQKQIKYYESLLPQIDECKETINNSSDAQAVKENLDKLLAIMDEIIDAPEELLNKAGMTNRTMQSQKEKVLSNYDILIKQAEESYS